MISRAEDYRYVDVTGFPITGHILPARWRPREKIWAGGFRKEDVLFLAEAAIERGVQSSFILPVDSHGLRWDEIRRLCNAYQTRIRGSNLFNPNEDPVRFYSKSFTPPSTPTAISISNWNSSKVFELFPTQMALPSSHVEGTIPLEGTNMRAELLGRMYLDLNDLTSCYIAPTHVNGSDSFGGYYGSVTNATYYLREIYEEPVYQERIVREASGSGNPTVVGSRGTSYEDKISYTTTYGDGRPPTTGRTSFGAYCRHEGSDGGARRYAFTNTFKSFESIDFNFRFDASSIYIILPCRLDFVEMTATGYPLKTEAFVFFEPLTKIDNPRSGYLSRWRLSAATARTPLTYDAMRDFLYSRGAHIYWAAGATPPGPEEIYGEMSFYPGASFFSDTGLLAVPNFRAEIASLNWNWTPPPAPADGPHSVIIG